MPTTGTPYSKPLMRCRAGLLDYRVLDAIAFHKRITDRAALCSPLRVEALQTSGGCIASVVSGTSSTAIPSGFLSRAARRSSLAWEPSHARRFTAHRSGRRRSGTEARKEADKLAVEAWNKRMLGFQGPAQPSPALGDAINAGFGYLEVKCPWLQHPPDRCPRHRAATEGNADPRTGTLHAVPPVLRSSALSVQAEPSGDAAGDQDHASGAADGQ